MDLSAEVIIFKSSNELVEKITELKAVFLDIEMPGMDGFEVGRLICAKNPKCKIIMETGNMLRFKEAFKINVFRFITKPFQQEEIDDALKGLLEFTLGQNCLELYFNRERYTVRQSEIIYFRAYNSYVEVTTSERCYRREISLNRMEEVLDERLFFRINRQYVINLSFVIGVKKREIHIADKKLIVSRRRWKEFTNKFL